MTKQPGGELMHMRKDNTFVRLRRRANLPRQDVTTYISAAQPVSSFDSLYDKIRLRFGTAKGGI
jgi:hypothetical protein